MPAATSADRNWRRFVLFRVLFNSRFYYPVLAILFLDLGLSATEYTLLNFAWAVAIVLTDVPAGVLADRFGRKPLVVAAAAGMIAEMVVLLVAPRHGGAILFLCCLVNRVLSGVAEGMASGADEALVFDSLAERNRADEWPLVLDQVMRWQSVGMVVAMLVGGACYDPVFMTRAATFLGMKIHFTQAVTLRFPIILNLLSAILALATVVGFREPSLRQSHSPLVEADQPETVANAWSILWSAGKWIFQTPVAVFVLIGGLLLDSVTRLLLTFSSSYLRLISLPEATFGLIGAALAGIGIFVAPVARRMVKTHSLAANYAILAATLVGALAGVAVRWQIWGVVFMLPLAAVMAALGFMVSYYLNRLVDPRHRATVLSFKGLAFNLGYGFIGLLFAGVLRAFRDGTRPDAALLHGFQLLPLWLVLTMGLLALAFWRRRQALFIVR